jgi:Diacylglycerol acyltransferase
VRPVNLHCPCPSYLPAYLPADRPTCRPAYLPTCLPAIAAPPVVILTGARRGHYAVSVQLLVHSPTTHLLTCFACRPAITQDYIIAQFPHGAFPLGAVVGGSFMATQYPEYTCYALAASSAFYVPVWRHVHAWLGTQTCTKANFHELLGRGVFGPQPRQSARRSSASATAGTSSGDMGAGTGSGMVLRRRASKMAPPAQAMSAQKCRSTSVDDSGMGTAANATGVGSLQLQSRPSARRSLTDSLRASLRGQHTLSDTESSDSDAAEACTACISSRASMTPLSRFSSIERRSCDAQPSQSAPWPLDPVTGRRRTGVSVGLMVGGIAEMFMIRPDHERIKLLDRKGFVRVAVERGVPILPVYMFGANQALDFGPPWLARLSRRLRASVGVMYGVWGLPVPRRVPIFKVSGRPLDVGPPMPKDDPGFAARVDAVHAAFVVEIQRIYYEHRGKYGCGFENRPLVIC